MSIPGYLTPQEIMAQFGWGRAQLSATAKREKWTRYKVGNAYLYDEQEIAEFALARNRTELLKRAGWKLQPGLVQVDSVQVSTGQTGQVEQCRGDVAKLLEDDPNLSAREIARRLNISPTTASFHKKMWGRAKP